MSNSDGFGQFHAPGPQDPYAGQQSADPYAGHQGSDPYSGQHGSDPFVGHQGTDPYGQQQGASYSAPQFGQGALPYGGPPQPTYVQAPPSDPLAVTSMILGIVSLTCLPVVGPIGLVLAIMGMKKTSDGTASGRGMAIAGLVLSILGTLYLVGIVLYFVFIIGLFAMTGSSGY